MKKDYYEVLGISKSSTADEIKKAYRAMARKHHPDVDKTSGAAEKFKEINEAYQVLSDPQKRQTYDQYGHNAFQGGNPFGGGGGNGNYQTYSWSSGGPGAGFDFGGFQDPFDIFEMVFGDRSPFGRQQRLPRYALKLEFMEPIKGVQKEIEIEGKRQKIKIPAGVDNGSEIRFKDFIIVCQVKPSDYFKRRDYDIITEQEINFSQAALGTQINVETIDGSVKIKIPSGTQPGTQIRLRGKGIKHVSGSGQGDHYLIISLRVPTKLSREQKHLLEELEKAK